MSNALTFIETNIEDLSKEEVIDKIIEEFKEEIKLHSLDYPNLSQLETRF